MSNCEKIAPMISEYVSGTLNSKDVLKVQSHLGRCADCARMAEEFKSLTSALRGISVTQPSRSFEDKLAQRLALLPRPTKRPAFSLARLIGTIDLLPRQTVRGSLAFAVAAVMVGGGFFANSIFQTATAKSSDAILLAHCVEQHKMDAAAQPLSDLSAQALNSRPDAQDSTSDALSDANDTDNL